MAKSRKTNHIPISLSCILGLVLSSKYRHANVQVAKLVGEFCPTIQMLKMTMKWTFILTMSLLDRRTSAPHCEHVSIAALAFIWRHCTDLHGSRLSVFYYRSSEKSFVLIFDAVEYLEFLCTYCDRFDISQPISSANVAFKPGGIHQNANTFSSFDYATSLQLSAVVQGQFLRQRLKLLSSNNLQLWRKTPTDGH